MLFNSFIYFIFLVIILPIYYLLSKKYKPYFLIICSYFFYGLWDWRFCLLLFISTVTEFFAGLQIYRTENIRRKKFFLFLSLFINLGILGFFKYFNFFIDSFESIIRFWGFRLDFIHLNILLPIGISFYTFQILTYSIDIYRGKIEPTNSFINFALFASFFPQLISGPIERASHLLPQISKLGNPTKEYIQKGFVLISIGLFRKVLIGDTCGKIVDQIFAQPSLYSSLELIMGLVLFSFQIYNDFAGYSSIARGTANLLGIDLMENFKQPYLAASITEFWRRWHISLSTWLSDYIFTPLAIYYRNLRLKGIIISIMVTFIVSGLWHGASWTFIIWGILHGIYLSIHRIWHGNKQVSERFSDKILSLSFIKYIFNVSLTYFAVLFSWLFFRIQDFSTLNLFIKRILIWSPSDYNSRIIGIILSYALLSFTIDVFEYHSKHPAFLLLYKPPVRYAILTSLWFFCLLYMFQAQPMPFIYAQF